jgi:hypothetical protein
MAERGSFENPVSINELTGPEREEFDRMPDLVDDPRSVVLSTANPDGSVTIEALRGDPDLCPECGAAIREKSLQEGGGVACTACPWWFCY